MFRDLKDTCKLTKHQIHGTNDCNGISQQVTLGNMVETTEMGETRGTNVASVRAFRAIADNVNTHLTLWRLDDGVGVTRRHGVTLGVEQEVVDQSLHVLLHGSSGRRRDLVVLDTDRTGGHLVQALVDDSQGLAELLHSAEVSVVAVTVGTNRDVELNLVISIVGLALSDVVGDTGTTQHDTSEGEVESLSSGDNTNAPQTLNPDTVVSKHLLGLINTITELSSPLVDVVKETNGDILVDTTGADVGSVETSSGNTFVEFLYAALAIGDGNGDDITDHELLTLLETPQERCQSANVHGVGQDRHQMVQDTGDLAEQGTNVLGTIRDLNVQQLLNSEGVALLVGHHGDVVQSVEVGQSLQIRLILDQLLGSAVQQTDVRVGSDNLLATQLENQTQHTVGSRMLRTKVDRVVSDLAVRNRVVARLSGAGGGLLGIDAVRVGGLEVLANRHEPGADVLRGGVSSETCRRERSGGEGCWSKAHALGSLAGKSVEGGHCERRRRRYPDARRDGRESPWVSSCSKGGQWLVDGEEFAFVTIAVITLGQRC